MLTPLVIAKEALIALENETVLSGLVHRDFSKEFTSVGATIVIRKPTVYTATVVSNTVNACTVAETSVAVVLNRLADITLSITSQDLSLEVEDFREQFIMPALRGHAQLLDLYGANEAVNFAGFATVSGTPALSDIVQLGAVLDAQKCGRPRNLVMGPITKAGYMVLEPFLYAEHRADGGKAMREAEMGRTLGFDCYMDQNMNINHSAGDMADAAGAMVGAGATGDGTATVDAITSAGTVKAGDVFKITGYDQWHRVSLAATANGTTSLIITFTPTFATTIADNAVVTFIPSGDDNLAFHKNALALVTRPLEAPLGGAKAAVQSYKGLSCRVVYDYNIMTKTNIMSIDMLYGWKTLDIALGARLIDSRSV
jgi:hypothetical protein